VGASFRSDVEAAAAGDAPGPAAAASAAAPVEPSKPAAGPETAKGDVQVVALSRVQQIVARRMAEATVPEFAIETEAGDAQRYEPHADV